MVKRKRHILPQATLRKKRPPVRSTSRLFSLIVLVVLAFSTSGCDLIARLTEIAYGEALRIIPPVKDLCPEVIRCSAPYCRSIQENGNFEIGTVGEYPTRWSGDIVAKRLESEPINIQACSGAAVLAFEATVADLNSGRNSRSAEAFQVIDLSVHVPASQRPLWKNVRASAAFYKKNGPVNNEFHLGLDVYSGDPSSFPQSGDHELFDTITPDYVQIATFDAFDFAAAEEWMVLQTALPLRQNADFLVVTVEAAENINDENVSVEFGAHYADRVRVILGQENLPPFASDDESETLEHEPVRIFVLRNDLDVDGYFDVNSITILQNPVFGSAAPDPSGDIIYTPEVGLVALGLLTDTFTYIVADNDGSFSQPATVEVEILGVYDAPIAVDDTYQVQGFNTLVVGAPGILGNDSARDFGAIQAVLVNDVAHGTLILDSDGSFSYTPDPGNLSDDEFTYVANDGTSDSNQSIVTLHRLAGPNIPPVAEDDAIESAVNVVVTINPLINDSDPDGVLNSATVIITEAPTNGIAEVLPDGQVRYTPNLDFVGQDQFKYTVMDNQGAVSNEATVALEIFG